MSAPPLGILYALPRRFSSASCPPLPPPTKEKRRGKGQKNKTRGQENTLRGQKNRGVMGWKNKVRGQKKPGVRKTGVQGLKKQAG